MKEDITKYYTSVENMFLDKIFPLVQGAEEERNKVNAWDAACSLATFE